MAIFDGISTADKVRLASIELSKAQMALWSLLLQIGVDPDSFNEESWEEPLNMETPNGRVRHYLDAIAVLKAKKAELENG